MPAKDTDLKTIEDRIYSFWRYVSARERLRVTKMIPHVSQPWTSDPVLDKYHFANARRIDDPGTKYFMNHAAHVSRWPDRILIASVVYRFVNRVETFEEFGWPSLFDLSHAVEWADNVAAAHAAGKTVLTGRYFSSVSRLQHAVHSVHNKAPYLMAAIVDLPDPCDGAAIQDVLRRIRYVGHFMSCQILADLSLFRSTKVDVHVCPDLGPGSRSAIKYMATGDWNNQTRNRLDLTEELILDQLFMNASEPLSRQQPVSAKFVPANFTPIDVEHSLCEWSKYLRKIQGHPVNMQLYVPRN